MAGLLRDNRIRRDFFAVNLRIFVNYLKIKFYTYKMYIPFFSYWPDKRCKPAEDWYCRNPELANCALNRVGPWDLN